MVKIVLIYGAETWSLYEDDRRRINAIEMDALRRSARISKLDRKTNEYIRGKMDAQDMILDDITRKQLIWYGHVERMDPMRLPKIMIHWKPEGRNKRGRRRRTWKDGIYTAMNERDLRMGEWNNRRQWNMKVGRRRKTFQNHPVYIDLIYGCVYILYLTLLGSQVFGACFSMSRPGRLFITYY